MKKKFLAAVMTVACVSTLFAGCGSSSSESDSKEGAAGASDEVWAAIQESGKITVGTETSYAPYCFRDKDGNLTGFDVEIAEALYGEMGLEIEWMDTEWDSLIAGLDAKKCDVVMDQISITEERQEKYLFSDVYTYTYGGLMVHPDSGITSLDDLDGKTCAETATCAWTPIVKEHGAKVMETKGFQDSVQLVEQGRADAILIENLTELDYLKNKPDSKLKIVATTDEPMLTAVMIRSGCDELQAEINKALATIKENGTLTKISEKYFGEDVTVEK